MTDRIEFQDGFGQRVTIDRVLDRLRLCHFNDPDDPTDFEVIVFPEDAERRLASMVRPKVRL